MKTALWAPLCVTGLAHALLLAVPLTFDPPQRHEDPVVKVRLRPPPPEPEPPPPEPEPPPPEPEVEPEPPLPEPEPPPPEPKPKREPEEPPPPDAEPPPAEVEPDPPPPSPDPPPSDPPPAMTTAPSPKATPVPAPVPAGPRGMSKAALRAYGMGVHGAMARHRRYPPAALQQRLEGVAKVRLVVDRRGRLVGDPTIARSSGHRVLDEEALRMVRVAAPFEPLPDDADKDTMVFVIPMDFSIPK
ncbi:energy transducer TonB [Paraliomyxa miuraensis]|uniref:energy transducer TonB n=1 Tax=Paraliomyxa miuraensis TaxID=376150 RepID=UPI0022581B94|nr:energy transducer TonB [Paraliomyxa miuraensis]MCX4242480.1 TonB family protein [Paraliomyxa miuraensis]